MLRSALFRVSVLAFGLVGCSSSEPPFQWGQGPDDAAVTDSAAGDTASSQGDEDSGGSAPDTSAPPPDVSDAPSAEEPWMPPACNATPSRGANVPYQEYEAETGTTTNGTVIGPSRAVSDGDVFNSIAGESSGRQAVKLAGTGQNVTFTTNCVANSIVVRYVIPDSGDGSGMTATLGLYVGGSRVQSLNLTSQYAWAYGDPTKTDATTNNPSDGFARHFYDEVRVLLPNDMPSGTTVALQQDASDTAAYYVIDLVDFEEVGPALGAPSNALSITDYGATPDDGSDDGAAIQTCLNAAAVEGKAVYIPPGTYDNAGTTLTAQNIAVQGAGMWRSTIQGAAAAFVCSGGACQFSDFSLYGNVTLRDDAHGVHAIGGPFGANSRIDNVWMEHFTTGPWIGQGNAPPITGMVIHGCRVRDLYADGINLNTGASNDTVEQCNVRNVGDDAFASWSSGSGPNTGNVFQFDTVQVTWRASCFAIYGGSNNSIQNSVCTDTVTYPGVFVAQEFSSSPFGGMTTVSGTSVYRAGGGMYGKNWGAVTIDGDQQSNALTGIQIQDVDIESATFSGLYFLGPNDAIQDMILTNITITSPGTDGINVDPSAQGTATATGVVVSSPGSGMGLNNQAASVFTIDRGAGDTGW